MTFFIIEKSFVCATLFCNGTKREWRASAIAHFSRDIRCLTRDIRYALASEASSEPAVACIHSRSDGWAMCHSAFENMQGFVLSLALRLDHRSSPSVSPPAPTPTPLSPPWCMRTPLWSPIQCQCSVDSGAIAADAALKQLQGAASGLARGGSFRTFRRFGLGRRGWRRVGGGGGAGRCCDAGAQRLRSSADQEAGARLPVRRQFAVAPNRRRRFGAPSACARDGGVGQRQTLGPSAA